MKRKIGVIFIAIVAILALVVSSFKMSNKTAKLKASKINSASSVADLDNTFSSVEADSYYAVDGVPNLRINAYFDDDGTTKKNGTALDIDTDDYAKLYVYINYLDSNAVIKNGKITVTGIKSIYPNEIQANEYITSATRENVGQYPDSGENRGKSKPGTDTVNLGNMPTGREFTMYFDYKNAVDSNGYWRDRFSNDLVVTVEGDLEVGGVTTHFTKTMNRTLEWCKDFGIDSVSMKDITSGTDSDENDYDICVLPDGRMALVFEVDSSSTGAIFESAEYKLENFDITLSGKTFKPQLITTSGSIDSGRYNTLVTSNESGFNNNRFTYVCTQVDAGLHHFQSPAVSYVSIIYNKDTNNQTTLYDTVRSLNSSETHTYNITAVHRGLGNENITYSNTSLIGRSDVPAVPSGESTAGYAYRYTTSTTAAKTITITNYTGEIIKYKSELNRLCKPNSIIAYKNPTNASNTQAGYLETLTATVLAANCIDNLKFVTEEHNFYNQSDADMTPNLQGIKKYRGIRVYKEVYERIGNSGWIKLRSAGSSTPFATITKSGDDWIVTLANGTTKNLENHYGYEELIFDEEYGKIEIETSEIVTSGKTQFELLVDIDNPTLITNFNESTFTNDVKGIKAPSSVYYNINNDYTNNYPYTARKDFEDTALQLTALDEVDANLYSKTTYQHVVGIDPDIYGASFPIIGTIIDPVFLVKYPESVSSIEIDRNSFESTNPNITVDQIMHVSSNNYVLIKTVGTTTDKVSIKFNVATTPNMNYVLTHQDENDDGYKIINYAATKYPNQNRDVIPVQTHVYGNELSTDTYDINRDGSTSENVTIINTDIKYKRLFGAGVSPIIEYDGDEYIQGDVAEISESDAGSTITIKNRIDNFSEDNLQHVNIIGVIPYEGNEFLTEGGSLGSDFTTSMTSSGITIPSGLSGVTVYYSTRDDFSFDGINNMSGVTSSAWNWKTAANVQDWSQIRTYRIDFGSREITNNETFEFSYNVKLPNDSNFAIGAESYTTVGVAYEVEGVYHSTSAGSVGMHVEGDPIDISFQKVDSQNTSTILHDAKYIVTRNDGKKIENFDNTTLDLYDTELVDSVELNFNASGNGYSERMLVNVGVDYVMNEVTPPTGYKARSFMFRIDYVNDNYVVTVKGKNASTGAYDVPVTASDIVVLKNVTPGSNMTAANIDIKEEKDEATYEVRYYFQQSNGTYPSTPDSVLSNQGPVTVGSTVTRSSINTNPENVADKPSGVYVLDDETVKTPQKTDTSITIAQSGNVFNVYFMRQTYTITYKEGSHGDFADDVHSGRLWGTKTPACSINPNAAGNHDLGYTFIGWKENDTGTTMSDATVQDINVTKDTVYVAQWQANSDTGYIVEYYYQENGTYPTIPNSSQGYTGTTGATATVSTQDKTPDSSHPNHVFHNGYSGNVLSGTITGDPSNKLTLKVYFKQQYKVTYKPGDHGTFSDRVTSSIDYGTATPAFGADSPNDAANHDAGYEFTGWSPTVASTVTQDATYVAQWSPLNYGYTVNYLDKATNNPIATQKTATAAFGTPITAIAEKNAKGTIANYTYDSCSTSQTDQNQITITTNPANNVINLFYTKNTSTYTVNYYLVGTSTKIAPSRENVSANVGDPITAESEKNYKGDIAGYVYDSCNPNQITITTNTANNVINLYYRLSTAHYSVEYYYQNANGTYNTVPDSTLSNQGPVTVGSTVYRSSINTTPDSSRGNYVLDEETVETPEKTDDSIVITETDSNNVFKVYFRRQAYTITYTEGDHGDFADDVHPGCLYGTKTPACRVDTSTAHEPGYEFRGWKENNTGSLITNAAVQNIDVTKNTTYVAQWEEADVGYTVEYYYQVNGQYPATTNLKDTSRTAPTGSTVRVTNSDKTPQMSGYVYDDTTSTTVGLLSATVAGDGSTVLKVFFKPQYTVNYVKGDHGRFATQTTNNIDYGNNTPAFVGDLNDHDPGYRFTGWSPTVANTVTQDATYVAQWEAIDVPYRVNYYYQVNGSYSTTPDDSRMALGQTGSIAQATSQDMTPQRTGFIYDNAAANVLSQTIAGDGSTVLKIYFKPQFKVTYEPGDQGTFTPQTTTGIDYGTTTPAFVGEKTCNPGYRFVRWNPTVSSTVTQDATYVAQWEAIEVPYTVEYYYEVNGVYPGTPDSTDTTRRAYTGSTVSVTNADKNPTKNGYVYDQTKSELVGKLSDTVAGDGSTVLQVYFKQQFVVIYLKGDHGGFPQQTTTNIDYGTVTPAFVGDLDNHDPGYEFTGWAPVVATTVTENATYVAQWRAIDVPYTVEFYYQENGRYPTTPYATVNRIATTDTPVSLTTPSAVNDMTVLVTDNKETNADISRPRYDSNYVYDSNAGNITSDNTVNGDGSTVLKVYFKEIPVNYDVDVVLKNTADTTLTRNQFTITRSGTSSPEQVLWDGRAVSDNTEIEERKAIIDTYSYKIYENETANSKYVNVLGDKYVGVDVHITNSGGVELQDFGIYNADGTRIGTTDPVYSYVVPSVSTGTNGYKKISIKVINPVTFTFQLKKVDTEGEALADTGMSITSEIIDDQNAAHSNEIQTESMNGLNITSSGVVTGETDNAGIIKYEETWVDADTYTYEITELQTAGNQYANILDGYKVVVTVQVAADGTLTLVRTNNRNYTIVATEAGKTVTDDLYNYVRVTASSNSLNAIIDGTGSVNVEVENPVKFNLDIDKVNTEGNGIMGVKFSVNRGNTQLFNGNVTANVEVEENPIDAGTYTYKIRETQAASTKYDNILENRYIQLVVKVHGDGIVEVLSQDGDDFKVFNESGSEVTDYDNVLKFVNINTEVNNDVYTVKVKVTNPLRYKVDIETKDTNGNFLDQTDVTIQRENVVRFNGDATQSVEVDEKAMAAGTYNYYFTQNASKTDKYVNPLDGKFIKAEVNVSTNGHLTVNKIEVYEGTIGALTARQINSASLQNYFNVTVDNSGDQEILKVTIIDPVRFTVKLTKVDTEGNGIENTDVTIKSGVIDAQDAAFSDENQENAESKNGLTIAASGNVDAATDNSGVVKYEEVFVDANTYTYEITENQTAGNQYVNVLDGYKIVVTVQVAANGNVSIVRQNGRNYAIVATEAGKTVTNDLYNYVNVFVANNSLNAIIDHTDMLNIEITNPVRFNMNLIKKDSAGNDLAGTRFTVERNGNTIFDNSAVTTGVEIEEGPISAGAYTYIIKENSTATTRYDNILNNRYIKLMLLVAGNGNVEIVSQNGKSFKVFDNNGAEVTDANILSFIEISKEVGTEGDNAGVSTINVKVVNPVKYNLDIETLDTANNFLDSTNVTVQREDTRVYSGYPTTAIECEESPIVAGTYNYYITQDTTKTVKYVNPLEGKFAKVNVTVAPDGMLTVNSTEIYEGAVGSPSARLIATGEIARYFSVTADNSGNISTLKVSIKDPVTFTVELKKIDTDGEALADTDVTIKSGVVDAQDAVHSDEIESESKDGLEIAATGEVSGTTNDAGIVKYEETWVDANTYTYEITEDRAAGNQYVNILEGYKVVVQVRVDANGALSFVRQNGRNYVIVATEAGKVVTEDLYRYVGVTIENDSLTAIIDHTGKLSVEITNPVRFNIDLIKKDTAGNNLDGTKFSVVRDRTSLLNNALVTSDIEIREDPIDAGTYTYIITENSSATTRYDNILENKYIQLRIKVNANGHIDILDQGENNFKVFDNTGTEITDVKNVLKYIEVWSEVGETGDQEGVTTVNVKVVNPVKYNVDITTATTAYAEDKDINDYFLDETDVIAYWVRADEKQDVWRGEPIKAVEKLVKPVEAGEYLYFFTQTSTRNNKLVNPLENKYVVAKVTVSADGMLTVGNVRLFRGTIGDPHTDEVVDDEAEKYYSITADNTGDISTLKILIIDPVRFTVEVNKLDTEEEQNGIENTQITINSSIIDEQNAVHEDEVQETSKSKDGLDIRENGQIEAETDGDGQIKFEETWVDSNESNNLSDANQNYYTYEITEDRTAGAQYVNVLEGYKVIVRVYVSPDGDLKLVNANGNEYSRYAAIKYTIVNATTGEEIPQDDVAYKYVSVSIVDDTVKAIIRETDMLKVDITNPVRFNIDLIKKDTDDNFLYGTLFSVNREGNDVPLFDESEVTEEIEITEEPMDAGIYTYYIRENETNKTVGNRYVNVLENKYIKLRLRVNGDGVIEILDNAGTHNSDYFEVYEEGTGRRITDDDVLRYISVLSHDEDGDGVYTVDVQVTNPVRYEIDIIKLDTLGNFLDQTNVTLYREENDENRVLYNGDATDVNVIHEVERLEVPMDAGTYVYYVTENRTKNERYVNIIEGRYIKITLTVAANGMLTVEQELYEGDVGQGTKVETGSVFDYYSVEVDNTIDLSNPDNVSRLNITLINPVKFIVELDKYDTAADPLIGATFEIDSPIIDEQDYEHDNRTISGIREGGITEDGTVTGTTEYDVERSPDGSLLRARISYEETWVDANQTEDDYYTYIMRETQTPGAQYVNMLDGYQVVVKVHVDPEGNLELKEVNGRNYEIVMTGEKDVDPVTDELYRYVSIRVSNNKILATLNTEVINPVRYKIAVHQTIYGDEQLPLKDIPVQVQSEFSGITTLVTDENGYSEMEEWAVWADTYEYRFFQLNDFMGRAVEDEFVNMFDGYYIGIDLYVPGDGDIKTISEDGDYTTVSYKIFKREDDGSYSQVNFRNTILNDFVRVKITKDEDNVCTLNIYFITPEKYDFRLVKTDIDTEFNMNNVQFSVTPSDENGEIELKKVDNSVKYKFNTIETKDQLTGIVDGVDGVISFKDILIERAGTYTFELEETTPIVEGMIYKDKSENVIVQADIAIENGKYVLTNMHVVQADRYTIPENTDLMGAETQTVNVNVTNERIKGSYDLVLNKFNKFTGLPLDGAVYKITVEQDGKENKVLYLSDGNVLSKNVIIPHVEEESISVDGVTAINDIRIEIPETYTIKIEEIKAPDTFTKLDDVIELEVTVGIEGEYDDAHYVLKEINLKDGNHDLVSETHSMPEDDEQNINVNIMNEYFDLALRQYITDVNGTAITNRAPEINLEELQSAEATTADYTQLKDPQRAYAGQEVIYTIEVYNEGIIDGYAEEIVEHLPRGLEFVDDEFNSEYGWRYDRQNHEVVTNILAREESEDNVIRAYDKDTMTLSSKKVQLKLRVADDVKLKTILTTIAEVRMSLAKDRKETLDRDSYDLASIPFGESLARYAEWQEDDDDFEKLVIEEFDLATVKYVKSVNGQEQENRKPRIALDKERMSEYKDGVYNGFNYKPDNELLKVKQNDVLVYGIEIFNEGSVGSYATEVRDTIPNGLIFNKNSEINKKYGWKMLDENENETDDVTKAKYVVTDYLSKAKETEENGNVIKALDVSDGKITIDSKVLEVEFTVTEPGKQSRIAENIAEVTKFIDDQNINVKDRDKEERLQENKEHIYIKIFDLELTQVINYVEVTNKVTGDVTVIEPDEAGKLAKVDIAKSKLMKTDILVEYSIKVTNNGETAGYATRVADYIPEGFEFNAEDNEGWAVEGDHLVTESLANTIINPGETKEVKLLLRWNGSSNNIGQMTNTSEIAEDKDENKKDVIDIDSTPNNLALAEDDIDITDILITVKTGSADIMIMIAALGLMIATSLGIAKYNNKRRNN